MKKSNLILALAILSLAMVACGSKKQTAASIAQEWCDLNGKVSKAPDGGQEYEKAKEARKKFEDEMEAKYEKDEAFMAEIGKEIEKCEDASEGK